MIFGGYNEQTSVTTSTMWRVWQRGTTHMGGNVTASGTMYYDNYGDYSHGYHEPYATTPQTALNEENTMSPHCHDVFRRIVFTFTPQTWHVRKS